MPISPIRRCECSLSEPRQQVELIARHYVLMSRKQLLAQRRARAVHPVKALRVCQLWACAVHARRRYRALELNQRAQAAA